MRGLDPALAFDAIDERSSIHLPSKAGGHQRPDNGVRCSTLSRPKGKSGVKSPHSKASRHPRPDRLRANKYAACAPAVRLAIFILLASTLALHAETIIEAVADQAFFSFEYERATDFSGLTWAGGSDFYTVSDKTRGIFPLRISLEPASGRILGAAFGAMLPVKTKLSDFEGLAFVPEMRRVYVSAERGNGIVGFDLATGATVPVAVPKIFARARDNKSLESLAFNATVGNFWTANEEALQGDGPVSGPGQGTTVRLQKFDRRFKPLAQFAYCTERSGIRIAGAGTGVSDLALLPNGELLALERVAGFTGLAAKIFRVDTRGATDVSEIWKLDGADFKPAAKKLLFERATLTVNFEGIALGPELHDGWRSLLLISDSGGGTTHYLMPLRIRWGTEK